MLPSYKTFRSIEFVNRNTEIDRAQAILSDRKRGVIIFEGERGTGKTSLLLELCRRFQKQPDLSPFLINLFLGLRLNLKGIRMFGSIQKESSRPRIFLHC